MPEPARTPLGVNDAIELRKVLIEQALRKIEALHLYEPLPEQAKFHKCPTRQRLLRGSNRGGKTLPAAVEVARAVTGRDPWRKYPTEDGRCFVVGKNLDHIGQVMWRKLARAGAFKIIRDEASGDWRAYRPWDLRDRARQHETKPAPPLIPRRLIESIAWENKAKSIPKMVKLKNGWELNFYSSEGKPPQGSDIDLWWFDEEITDEEWHPEMVARILDRRGKGLWSATPQAGTERLYELHEIAERETAEGEPNPTVSEFVILLAENPHIGEQEKKEFAASLSEEEAEVRIGGQFVVQSRRVFPEFRMEVHGWEAIEIPHDWTRFAIVDPGRQICAVLFAAVPPPELGDYCYLYDELYIPNASAELFGIKMGQKAGSQAFEAFVIDSHGARLSDIGSGRSVEWHYTRALRKYKVRSHLTGHGFFLASDDVDGTLEAARDWLRPREDGPKLRVLKGKCPNFEWEVKRYRYKAVNGITTDKPEDRGRVHLMACLRYLAAYRPKYRRPPAGLRRASPAVAALRAKEKRRRARAREEAVNLGPAESIR